MKIITALVTPFDENNQINYPVLDQIITMQINNNVDGIVIGGTTGELPTLSEQEMGELYKYVCKKYHDQVPIFLGVGCASTTKTIERIKTFNSLPCGGYLIVVPYYNLPPQKGLIAHFTACAKATKKEIMLYNVPKRTGTTIDLASISALAEIENITMIKDATQDRERLLSIHQIPNIELYLGDDQMFLWGIKNQIPGIVSVISNLEVKTMKDCASDETLHSKYEERLKIIQPFVNPIGIKRYLRANGYPVGTVRLPLCE